MMPWYHPRVMDSTLPASRCFSSVAAGHWHSAAASFVSPLPNSPCSLIPHTQMDADSGTTNSAGVGWLSRLEAFARREPGRESSSIGPCASGISSGAGMSKSKVTRPAALGNHDSPWLCACRTGSLGSAMVSRDLFDWLLFRSSVAVSLLLLKVGRGMLDSSLSISSVLLEPLERRKVPDDQRRFKSSQIGRRLVCLGSNTHVFPPSSDKDIGFSLFKFLPLAELLKLFSNLAINSFSLKAASS